MAFMLWQKRSIQLILGFPLALPMVSHAVNVGETYIESGQNEPLKASINVTDIDPKTFSVKIATPEMYQQLGLSHDQAINAKFQPTSSNGGKIILTTDQPVATPYADVVLNLDNKGEKNVLPKTLLMPMNGSQQLVTQPQSDNAVLKRPKIKKTIAKNATVSLPETSRNPDINPADVPLVISKDAPPDLSISNPTSNPTPQTVTLVPVTQPIVTSPIPPTLIAPVITEPSPSLAPVTPTIASLASITAIPSATPPLASADTPSSNNLIIQETRRILPIGSSVTTTPTDTNTTIIPSPTENTPHPPITKPKLVKTKIKSTKTDEDDDTTTYVIQRNDSLWSIASTVAKRNGKNVHQVMQDIIDDNPDAFENGDPARMLAHTELEIPNYNSVPSQASIQANRKNRTRTVVARSPAPRPTPAKATQTTASSKKNNPYQAVPVTAKPSFQPLPLPKSAQQAQLNIISANQTKGTAQGQHTNKANDTQGSSPQLIEEIKQRRITTASQATRVNQLNNVLSSAEQRLKIQNEKLAMLEKRLKELNSQ